MSSTFLTPILLVAPASLSDERLANWLYQKKLVSNSTLDAANVRLINQEKTGLKIETVRDLIQDLSYTPYGTQTQVYVFYEFDATQPVAQNALLKTLEEPPAQTQLVLVAHQIDSILPTIKSRCLIEYLPVEPVNQPDNPDDTVPHTSAALTEFYGKLTTNSYADLIDLAEAYTDRDQALSLISNLIKHLTPQANIAHHTHHLSALVTVYDQLKKNGNVRLVVENCFFKIKDT